MTNTSFIGEALLEISGALLEIPGDSHVSTKIFVVCAMDMHDDLIMLRILQP